MILQDENTFLQTPVRSTISAEEKHSQSPLSRKIPRIYPNAGVRTVYLYWPTFSPLNREVFKILKFPQGPLIATGMPGYPRGDIILLRV